MSSGASTTTAITGHRGTNGAAGADGTLALPKGGAGGAGTVGEDATNSVIADIQTGITLDLIIEADAGAGGIGGHGGIGASGAQSVNSAGGTITTTTAAGADGGTGGDAASGGSASAIYQSSTLTSGSPVQAGGTVSVAITSAGGNGGTGGGGGAGGSSGDGITGPGFIDITGAGGASGNGGRGGDGGAATSLASGDRLSLDRAAAVITATALGGLGNGGGGGNAAGFGGIPPGNGGNGGAGGRGGLATATLANITADLGNATLTLTATASAGSGGNGGFASNGGSGLTGPLAGISTVVAPNGAAGAGGDGGAASASLTGSTITGTLATANSVTLQVLAAAGAGGAGGWVGAINVGPQGAQGADGTASLTLRDNSITLQGAQATLAIALQANGGNTALDASNLVFSGNNFSGGGLGTLDLGGVFGAGAIIDVAAGTLRLAGGPANLISGWSRLIGTPQADRFIDGVGAQSYDVTNADPAAPDLLIFNPGHGDDSVTTTTAFVIDLSNFGPGLANFAQVQAAATLSGATGTRLATPDGGSITLPTLTPAQLTASEFTFATACYRAGTAIATEHGDIAIEHLRVGQTIRTAAGALRPIVWIGRRSYDEAQLCMGGDLVWPVLIRTGALADNLPRRDLFVSPEHALFLDGMLVPARHIVNGATIVQAPWHTPIDYLHIELAGHDLLLAEGVAAETFADCDNRALFDNHEPAATTTRWAFCAPRVEHGAALADLRHRLAQRAGLVAPDTNRHAITGPLIGRLERAGPTLIEGWAQDRATPEHPVELEILADGVVVAAVVANRYRDDLRDAGLGSGRHAFRLPGLAATAIMVRRVGDQALLG